MAARRLVWVGYALIVCGVVGAMLIAPAFLVDMRRALHEPSVLGVDERLTDVRVDQISWLAEQKGGRWGRYGWYLGPGEQGHLRLSLPGSKRGNLKLRLWVFAAGPTRVLVVDSAASREIPTHELDGHIITIPTSGSAALILEAASELSHEQLILDRFAAGWFPENDHLPPLWRYAWPTALWLTGWGVIAIAGGSSGRRRLWFGSAVILLAVIVGVELRWALFDISRALPVDSDVVGYIAYARSLEWFTPNHGFYSGSFVEREPGHVAAFNIWTRLWGDTVPAVRFYTLCLSVLLIVVAGAFIWRLSGAWVLGALAAWIMALSPAWIDESVRGLRLECMSLMLAAALSLWVWARGWSGAILLGVATGLTALVQSPALGVVLPLLWVAWLLNLWRGSAFRFHPCQWTAPKLAVVSVLAVLLYVPHLQGLYKVHGDPSWPSHGYARWNANVEFPERHGTPGFPTAEEFARTPYAGPPISYGEYLFGLHSIGTLVRGQIKGWAESTAYMSVSATPHLKSLVFLHHASGWRAMLRQLRLSTAAIFALALGLTAVGWVDLWRHRTYWWVPFMSLWGTWYVAYLYSVRLVEPFRHTAHVYLLLLFCLLWGATRLSRLRADFRGGS